MRRIQFFESNDYACTYNLDKAEQYLSSDNYNIFSINDCMEAYNVCMFLDKDYRYNSWDDSYYEMLKKKCSLLFNYYLNKAEYIDGKDLRNMYAHGIHPVVSNEKEHEYNYFLFLKLFIILIIKINDEFDLRDGLNSN